MPNSTRLQHFLQVVLNLLDQWQGDLSKSFLKKSVIHNFIICSVEWVKPNSTGSNENMSWYLAKSQQAAYISSGAQESRPLKSNSSNNLPCLYLMASLGVWGFWGSSAPSSNWNSSEGLGTGDAATALATWVLFWRVCEYVVLFLTTMTAFLLPCLNSLYGSVQ